MSAFSLQTYKQIICGFVDAGYAIKPAVDSEDIRGQTLLLRHDVDYSISLAAQFATANAEMGVCGCFHLPIRSPLINLAAESSLQAIETLRQAGQCFALHFYLSESLVSEATTFDDLKRTITRDHQTLREIVGDNVLDAFSWHNPSLLVGIQSGWVTQSVEGLINAYTLQDRGVQYLSDSNNRYTTVQWREMARTSHGPMQVLFHPFQWMLGADDMMGTLANTYAHLVESTEQVFQTNVVFQKEYPGGLHAEVFQSLRNSIAKDDTHE